MTKPNFPHKYPPPDKRQRPLEEGDQELQKYFFSLPSPLLARRASFQEILSQVNEKKIKDWASRLVKYQTRHTLSPLNLEAALWLREQFQAIGYTDVGYQDFQHGGATRHNVVCTKRGEIEPDEFIIVCAHYDSRMESLQDFTSVAPGGDDNASGVAALLELARVLHQTKTRHSVRFICFSGEEQGFIGSSAYADFAKTSNMKIKLVINLDMVGHPTDPANPTIIVERDVGNAHTSNDVLSKEYAVQMAQAAAAYTSLHTKFGKIYSSDYMPFEMHGFVCIGAYDGADGAPFYHTKNDTLDKVNISFCAEVVKMLAATVLTISS